MPMTGDTGHLTPLTNAHFGIDIHTQALRWTALSRHGPTCQSHQGTWGLRPRPMHSWTVLRQVSSLPGQKESFQLLKPIMLRVRLSRHYAARQKGRAKRFSSTSVDTVTSIWSLYRHFAEAQDMRYSEEELAWR